MAQFAFAFAFIKEHKAAKVTHHLDSQHRRKCRLPCKGRMISVDISALNKDLGVQVKSKFCISTSFNVIVDEDKMLYI